MSSPLNWLESGRVVCRDAKHFEPIDARKVRRALVAEHVHFDYWHRVIRGKLHGETLGGLVEMQLKGVVAEKVSLCGILVHAAQAPYLEFPRRRTESVGRDTQAEHVGETEGVDGDLLGELDHERAGKVTKSPTAEHTWWLIHWIMAILFLITQCFLHWLFVRLIDWSRCTINW